MILENEVGPVLNVGVETESYIAALQRDNPQLRILDYKTYVRALHQQKCSLSRKTLEEELGASVLWPECLEAIMPSFKGRLKINSQQAEWSLPGGSTQ